MMPSLRSFDDVDRRERGQKKTDDLRAMTTLGPRTLLCFTNLFIYFDHDESLLYKDVHQISVLIAYGSANAPFKRLSPRLTYPSELEDYFLGLPLPLFCACKQRRLWRVCASDHSLLVDAIRTASFIHNLFGNSEMSYQKNQGYLQHTLPHF